MKNFYICEFTVGTVEDMCSKWSEVLEAIEKHHPCKVEINRTINILNENIMAHFEQFLQITDNFP